MTLSLYIARRFTRMVALVFFIFFGIMWLIEILEKLRRFSDDGISFGRAAQLALLNVPESIYRILPLIMILAAVALFLNLARTSELVVVRAAGQSALRFLLTPVITAVLMGIAAVLVFNPLVAATSKQYDALYSRLARGNESVLSVSEEGLWLRQGGASGQTVIHAARASLDGTHFYGATFLIYDADGIMVERIETEEADLGTGGWTLSKAKRWQLATPNPETAAETVDQMRLVSDLTIDAIRDGFGTPSSIPIWDLPDYIRGLEDAGFSARQHRVWFQMELALPVLLAAMVTIAAGFTMRHARFGKTGQMVLYALLGGFGIFFLRNFAQVLGVNGQIPVALAAWSPPVAAVLGSVGLLLHLEDG